MDPSEPVVLRPWKGVEKMVEDPATQDLGHSPSCKSGGTREVPSLRKSLESTYQESMEICWKENMIILWKGKLAPLVYLSFP